MSTEATEKVGPYSALMSPESEMIRRTDIDALIKALKKISGNTLVISFATSSMSNLIIVDFGAFHHMISNTRLIKKIGPDVRHVIIGNGDRIPSKGVGNLKLFDK